MRKNLIISISISLIFLIIIRLRPIWERYPGGSWNNIYHIATIILFLLIVIKIAIEIYRLSKKRVQGFRRFIPVLILTTFLIDGLFNPFRINLDKVYGEITFRACYEGTMNTATLKLREKGGFDLHWTGAFGYDEFFLGTYCIKGDTLRLLYNDNKPVRFGNTIYMDNEQEILVSIYSEEDSLQNVVEMYYGYCKGLN